MVRGNNQNVAVVREQILDNARAAWPRLYKGCCAADVKFAIETLANRDGYMACVSWENRNPAAFNQESSAIVPKSEVFLGGDLAPTVNGAYANLLETTSYLLRKQWHPGRGTVRSLPDDIGWVRVYDKFKQKPKPKTYDASRPSAEFDQVAATVAGWGGDGPHETGAQFDVHAAMAAGCGVEKPDIKDAGDDVGRGPTSGELGVFTPNGWFYPLPPMQPWVLPDGTWFQPTDPNTPKPGH